MEDIEFKVIYNDKSYAFEYGSEAYIFHTGIYNDMEMYGIDELLKYVTFVQNCYLKDSNRTPLGSLADYIAQNWESVKNKNHYSVLADFYNYLED